MSQNNATPAVTPAKFEEATVDGVIQKIAKLQQTGELSLPDNYNAENAIRAAWLILQDVKDRNDKPALEVCTKASIANAMYEMVMKGLSVVKKQGYFIVYGNQLSFDESYIGDIAIAKRDCGVEEVNAVVIYDGDVFEYEIDLVNKGRKKVTKHEQTIANINPDKIVGAYAIVTFKDGTASHEIMTIAQIRLAWAQGAAKGNSPAHKNFPDQMACKTVINRALKIITGTSDDSHLQERDDQATASLKQEIKDNANKKEIGIDDKSKVKAPVAVKTAAAEKPSAVTDLPSEPVVEAEKHASGF